MLTVSRPMSVGKAGHYFKSDDYYLSEKGEWQGKAAETMGLRGEVANEDFKAVLRGHDPRSGEALLDEMTDRETGAGKRRGGVDLTFSAPKSVSILALADGRIKEAHEAGVSAVVEYVERHHGHAREQEDGSREVVTTGNLAVAKFTHMVSRASGGEVLPDPQLHTHSFVVNLTQKDDGAWRAHHNDALYRDQLALGRFYRAELARNLRELGYGIEVTEPASFLWEAKGVPGEVLGEFSKRRQQILERAEELRAAGEFPKAGETALREIANRDTRLPKGKVPREVLLEHWTGTLREMGHTLEELRDEALREGRKDRHRETQSARDWVLTAARLRTETESVFTREEVLDLAARVSRGAVGFRELDRALSDLSREERVPFLGTVHVPGRSGRTLPREAFTTPEMQAMESEILKLAQNAKDAWSPIASEVLVAGLVADREAVQGWRFTQGQVEAARTILTSSDRINVVQGDAGTGKTAALALVREVAEERGVRAVGLGFTGKAAQELADGAGIPSKTLDSFLHSARAQDLPPGSLLVVDEASMAGSRHFHRLLTLTRDRDWKVVLVGDTKQFPSIAAGRNHALLQERSGVDTVHLTEVVRQETEHAHAVVNALSQGDTDRALRELRDREALRQIGDREARLGAVVERYLSLRDAKREVLLLSATNADRIELNERIRSTLVARGQLEPGRSFRVQEPTGAGPEETALASSYEVGQRVLVLGEIGKGLDAGTHAEVVGVDRDRNRVRVAAGGRTHEITLFRHYDKLAVYRVAERSFAPGDRVVFLKNDEKLRVQNGLQGAVKHLDERGNLVVKTEKGREVRFRLTDPEERTKGDARYRYNYLTHAYAVTEYKSQGATTSAVIWYADTRRGRIHRNSFYVAATRARHDVWVFTDDRERLRELVRHPREKTSTLDHLDDRIERAFAAWRDGGPDFRREDLRPAGPASTAPKTRETEDVKAPRVRERDRELERSR